MPWNVQLEDESGKVLAQVVAVSGFLPAFGNEGFPMLRFVDPWGDTVFNRDQLTPVMEEWARLREAAEKAGQLDEWEAVERLARRCQSEVHTYIKFVGD